MKSWRIKEKSESGDMKNNSLSLIILNLLAQRGINTEESVNNFISPDYNRDVHNPFLFSQMEKVVERIKIAKEKNELVAVFGDYDADGVTATIILKETLDIIGINSIIYIPDKKEEGYSLNLNAVEEFKSQEVKLIITVDCGITSREEINRANDYGIDVVVTDHHNIPSELPNAFAVINPKIKNSGYPDEKLAGVGVAFKLVQALYEKLLPEKKEQLKWLLDLTAIGTVADCVPLLGENRTLVKYGLIVLSKTRRAGLKEIFNVGRLKIDENNVPDSRNISFQIAPRINAAGRMDHANVAYELLAEQNIVKARELALELEDNNQRRQKETERVVEEIRILAENSFKNKKLIFAVGEHFPIGIAGLAAGKIADAFNKPAAVLYKGEKESIGSLRSVSQLDITEALKECGEFLVKYGGHSQAAGVTVLNENLEAFYEKFNAVIEDRLKGINLVPEIEIDAEITAEDINFELVEAFKKMEPFGEGNPKPVFLLSNLIINDFNIVGSSAKHLKLFLRSENGSPKIFEAIGFNFANRFKEIKKGDKIDAVFHLEQDEWNGNKKIQMNLIDLRKV